MTRVPGRLFEDRRVALAAAGLAIAIAIVWTASVRWSGLDPQTLWADDVWVASLTHLPLVEAIRAPAPAPPGFVAMLWIAHRLAADPELPLQAIAFVCGLLGPMILGHVVARATSSRALGVVALALACCSPYLAYYSVFVKQYTLDFAVTAALLWLGDVLLWQRRDRLALAAAAGLGAALVSIPSIFVSVVLVHVAALSQGLPRRSRSSRRRLWKTIAIVGVFDAALAAIYFFLLADRSTDALNRYWRADFLPVTSVADAIAFLKVNGRAMLANAMPGWWGVLAWLAPVGLVSLLVPRASRAFGCFILLVYAALIVASSRQLYPIGVDFRGRTVMFSYAPTIALVVFGVHALTRWIPGSAVIRALAAAAALALVLLRPAPSPYPALDHERVVRRLETRAGSADAVVFNTSGAYLAGYYTSWPIAAVRDDSPQGFAIHFRRPLTLTLPRGAEEGSRDLAPLDQLLAGRPTRVFLFTTRRGTAPVEARLKTIGYVETGRVTTTISTTLVEYVLGG